MTTDQPGESLKPRGFGEVQLNPPTYTAYETYSTYVRMRDGVRIAVNYTLPTSPRRESPVPAILVQTRYWRSIELTPLLDWILDADEVNPRTKGLKRLLTGQGYALVVVDVRGTGASFGTWRYPWAPESIADAREIIDWIVDQPWSNGKVGAFGISYLGTTAEFLLTLRHDALKAVVPMFNHPDPYRDIGLPGGILNKRFIKAWSEFDEDLDQGQLPALFGIIGRLAVRGIKPVDGRDGRLQLKAALQEHKANGNTIELARLITYRDDTNEDDLSIEEISLVSEKHQSLDTKPAVFSWASWMDAGTARSAIERFQRIPNPHWAVIGAWNHGGILQANPYDRSSLSPRPSTEQQWREMIHFFDVYLKGQTDHEMADKQFFYYTMGEEAWKWSNCWPPNGFINQPWYLREDSFLSLEPPQTEGGYDRYQVDFSHTTGLKNRWWELGATENKSVEYGNSPKREGSRLQYLTQPFNQNIEITGTPLVQLYLSSDTEDGALYVYLEDIDERGISTYVTEGLLRLIHRRTDQERLDFYETPLHSYLREHASPMPRDEFVPVSIAMLPTSVLIRRGHRIRIAIAGHDADTFIKIPDQGNPVYTVARTQKYPSRLILPVQYR